MHPSGRSVHSLPSGRHLQEGDVGEGDARGAGRNAQLQRDLRRRLRVLLECGQPGTALRRILRTATAGQVAPVVLGFPQVIESSGESVEQGASRDPEGLLSCCLMCKLAAQDAADEGPGAAGVRCIDQCARSAWCGQGRETRLRALLVVAQGVLRAGGSHALDEHVHHVHVRAVRAHRAAPAAAAALAEARGAAARVRLPAARDPQLRQQSCQIPAIFQCD